MRKHIKTKAKHRCFFLISRFPIIIVLFSLSNAAIASAESSFTKDLQPYLDAHCLGCHGAEKQEGEFRIDTLSREVGLKDTPHWAESR